MNSEQSQWGDHYNIINKKDLRPASTLLMAIDNFKKEFFDPTNQLAIDLGAGNGIDTLALLQQGWKVLAIDKEHNATHQINLQVPPIYRPNVNIMIIPFEQANFPKAMMINASFSLPFCSPGYFPSVWKKITTALQAGGRFAGHFFGHEDSWAHRNDMTFLQSNQITELFANFSIEKMEETKREGRTLDGQIKQWHIFHVVAQYQ